ncbi:MAG TPA: membrane-associated protein, partial [Candidatus Binatia bacterium]|nr:membrane-associated protein [Candidatus Binatia bacterium]
DQRAFVWQTIVALVVLPLSYLLSNAQENVNWVYGFGQNPQKILPGPLFVILLMLLFPLIVYLPTHLLFTTIFRERAP